MKLREALARFFGIEIGARENCCKACGDVYDGDKHTCKSYAYVAHCKRCVRQVRTDRFGSCMSCGRSEIKGFKRVPLGT